MQLLPNSNLIGVALDEPKQAHESGIILTKSEAICLNEQQRTGTVVLVPHKTIFNVKEKEILIDPPVKVGDRVIVTAHAGVSTVEHEGRRITLLRVREILATLEE